MEVALGVGAVTDTIGAPTGSGNARGAMATGRTECAGGSSTPAAVVVDEGSDDSNSVI